MNDAIADLLKMLPPNEVQPTHRNARKRTGLPPVNGNTIAAARKAGLIEEFFDGPNLMMRRI